MPGAGKQDEWDPSPCPLGGPSQRDGGFQRSLLRGGDTYNNLEVVPSPPTKKKADV